MSPATINLSNGTLTMDDVADILKVNYELVRDLKDDGLIHFWRVGRRQYRTTLDLVERYMVQNNPDTAIQQIQANAKARTDASRAMDSMRSRRN